MRRWPDRAPSPTFAPPLREPAQRRVMMGSITAPRGRRNMAADSVDAIQPWPADQTNGRPWWFSGLGFSGLRRGLGTIAPFRHELVELGLVPGHGQTLQEVAKFALLLFQPPQRVGP